MWRPLSPLEIYKSKLLLASFFLEENLWSNLATLDFFRDSLSGGVSSNFEFLNPMVPILTHFFKFKSLLNPIWKWGLVFHLNLMDFPMLRIVWVHKAFCKKKPFGCELNHMNPISKMIETVMSLMSWKCFMEG